MFTCFKNSFIKIYLIFFKIHNLKVCNSVVFTIFTELCQPSPLSNFRLFPSAPKETLSAITVTPITPFP